MLRVDDAPTRSLESKQGYGKARGLWQRFSRRAGGHVDSFEVHPSLAEKRVELRVRLSDPAPAGAVALLRVPAASPGAPALEARQALTAGAREARLTLPLGASPRLWSLEDPHVYDATLSLTTSSGEDRVKTYFGFREIGVAKLPGLGHPYVSLNGKPLYLQLTLDQGWHPDGFYTWPSDTAMREEVLIARRLGLNAIRTHVKVELPRKLYWADRLGVLVMSDVPNSWGEPDAAMKKEWETAFRGMVRRDFNHPSIFSWVLFNEQWGLLTPPTGEKKAYLPETQAWVVTAYDLAKAVDPTRLIEDNSPCCETGGHVKTDMNTWHMYLPGWKWKEELDGRGRDEPGSNWNHLVPQPARADAQQRARQRQGYEGSTGDVDWADYHAIGEFRRHPKTAGWLYEKHHDVINEWNGYGAPTARKETGLNELVPSISPATGTGRSTRSRHPVSAAKPGETVPVPLWARSDRRRAGGRCGGRARRARHARPLSQWWKGERTILRAVAVAGTEPSRCRCRRARAAVLRATLGTVAGGCSPELHELRGGEGASPRDVGAPRRRDRRACCA